MIKILPFPHVVIVIRFLAFILAQFVFMGGFLEVWMFEDFMF